jgi:methyltransferase (TIGR00027 family)
MNNISATAHLIAMYRALETERPDALFCDPFARRLAGGEGVMMVEVLGDRQQSTTAITIWTCAIDALLKQLVDSGCIDTVLNLGAGLDTRPYRLNLPASVCWIEVDLPKILMYKEQKLSSEQPVCLLKRIKLDLMDIAARRLLFDQVSQTAKQVLVITEGLLSYLTEAQVASLAGDLHQQSSFRWWLFELASPAILQQIQKSKQQRLFDQYFANGNPTFLFAPEQGTDFFRLYGWKVNEFRSLWEEACHSKRRYCLMQLNGLSMRWFAKQRWQALTQHTGFVLLEQLPLGATVEPLKP